jgi:hypothetical protein
MKKTVDACVIFATSPVASPDISQTLTCGGSRWRKARATNLPAASSPRSRLPTPMIMIGAQLDIG